MSHPTPPSPPPPPAEIRLVTARLTRLESLAAYLAVVAAVFSLPLSSFVLLLFGCPCVDPLSLALIVLATAAVIRQSSALATTAGMFCLLLGLAWSWIAVTFGLQPAPQQGTEGIPVFAVAAGLAVLHLLSGVLAARSLLR